jgi:outer membrane protein assembly factor BamB
MKRWFALLFGSVAGVLVLASAAGVWARATAAPVVSGFSPPAGVVGAAVTVTGTGFTGATAVAFNGTAASFTVIDDADIQTSVPFSATTGKIRVTTPAGSGSSATAFKVTPTVSAFSPRWGLPGTVVTITGSAFTGATLVRFGGAAASSFRVDSYTQITATVPAGASTGKVKVKAGGPPGASAAKFDVLVAGPGWPQFRYDNAHSGTNPNETILGPSTVAGLELDWSGTWGGYIRDDNGPFPSSPAVANGIVYIKANDGTTRAFDAASGTSLWSASIDVYTTSSPAVANGIVYVGSYGVLKAFDAASGAPLWSASIRFCNITSSPAVANGVVYVGSECGQYGKLSAFDAASGALLWSATPPGYAIASPAVANGIVYYGAVALGAFDAANGALLWSAPTDAGIESSPALANGVVYVGDRHGTVYAFNAASGAQLWSTTTTGAWMNSSPAVANGIVYIGSEDGNLYAFNAADGSVVWKAATGNRINSSPAVANGVVYVGSVNKLVAFDAASGGAPLWSVTNRRTDSSPAVANGVLYVGSGHSLFAYHLPPAPQSHKPTP